MISHPAGGGRCEGARGVREGGGAVEGDGGKLGGDQRAVRGQGLTLVQVRVQLEQLQDTFMS